MPLNVRPHFLSASEGVTSSLSLAATVEFEGLHYQFEETRGHVELLLLRGGNLEIPSRVNCMFKPGTASGYDFAMVDQTVEFQPGKSTSGM